MAKRIHWRQLIILIEIAILAIVGFIPHSLNMAATVLVSFSCAMQVQAFRKVNGFAYASTMCIGNLRMATQSICDYWFTKDKTAMEKGFLFFGIIAIFTIGAIMGNVSVRLFSEKAILVSSILLITAFSIMLINKED